MPFAFAQKVLCKHCDPAGIVFYPRYFEMINDAVEALFAEVLGWPFEEVHKTGAVPTASFNVNFRAPSRHGDQLMLHLVVTAMGGGPWLCKWHADARGHALRRRADRLGQGQALCAGGL